MPRLSTSYIDQVKRRDVMGLRAAGRQADAAIAHHHAGDSMPRRAGDLRVPADLGVVMGVRIDEAGGDDQSVGVNRLLRSILDLSDFRDDALLDRNIGQALRRAGSVHYRSVFDQQVV
jgi:hypothetical protein